jgi:D-galactarolactone cycloisomerase
LIEADHGHTSGDDCHSDRFWIAIMTPQSFVIRRVQAFCYSYPLLTPVVTSFGLMLNRPAVFVRVEDEEGNFGWGEVWANFPSTGAEHRARMVNEFLAPAMSGFKATYPADVFESLTQRTAIIALQSGEPGPFAQAIAGIDIAIWDLYAKRCSTPLWRLLGGANSRIRAYASGINPTGSRQIAEMAVNAGHRALKLKIGFDLTRDRENLAALRELVGDGVLAADVNQAWSKQQALEIAPRFQEFRLAWLEEPIRADRPWDEWQALRRGIDIPLAAGENISSRSGFAQVLSDNVLQIVQPDVAKWGGVTICAEIARDILASGKTYCPHYLGGGIGLLASAHLLAGVGGDGLLEVDVNPNPLRDYFCGPVMAISDGTITLTDWPGLGIDPDFAPVETYRTA